MLGADGKPATWPKADALVGNPPFFGNKKMIRELGEDYTVALRRAYPQVPGGVDLVAYWFAQAWAQMKPMQIPRAGPVCIISIRGGANREVLKPIVDCGRNFAAWADESWTLDGAAVRVSMIGFYLAHGQEGQLEGVALSQIFPDLKAETDGLDISSAATLRECAGISFQGVS